MNVTDQAATTIAPGSWEDARRRIVAYVARRVDSPEAAEDITQGVFERLARTGPETIDNPQAWLHRAARNVIVDHYRTRRLHLPLDTEIDVLADAADGPFEHPERELAHCLRPLIDQLPGHYRRALITVDLDGETHAVAAEREHLSISGMKSRVQRARRLLAGLLTDCCRITFNADNSVDDYAAPPGCDCSQHE